MCVVCIEWLQVHGREIIDKMLKAGCNNRNAFEWLSQLRLYWVSTVRCHIFASTATPRLFTGQLHGNEIHSA